MNYARASSEVLIEGPVPPEAIVKVYSTDELEELTHLLGSGPRSDPSGGITGPDTYYGGEAGKEQ